MRTTRLFAVAIALVGTTWACQHHPHPLDASQAPMAAHPDGPPAPRPLLDRALFFDEGGRSVGTLSHDGAWLSYYAPHGTGRSGLFVGRTDDAMHDGRFVVDATRVGYQTYSVDDRYLIVGLDRDGDEDLHLHVLDLQDSAAPLRDLTQDLPAGASAEVCALPRDEPGVVIATINARDLEVPDVVRIDLGTGEHRMVFESPPNTAEVHCDASGRPRVLLRAAADQFELMRIDGQQTTLLRRHSVAEEVSVLGFAEGGAALLMTNAGDRDKAELVQLDLEHSRETLLHADPEQRVDIHAVVLDRRTRELQGVAYIDDRLRHYAITPRYQAVLELARELQPDADMWIHDYDDGWSRIIVGFDGPTLPPVYYLLEPDTRRSRMLVSSRPRLESTELAPTKPLRYTARDGLELSGYLTVRRDMPERDLPLVMLVHGGPWARDLWGYDPEVQFLANRGYAVFQPNFRGSTGFGKAFENAANHTWGTGAAQHDLEDGVDALVARGIVDPDRVCIYGGSYGGYATLAGLAFTPERYACGVSYVGPSNLVTLIESFPAHWRNLLGAWFEAFGDPAIASERADLESRSPLFFVDQIVAPLMVVQGANDPRVRKPESDRIVDALRARGRAVRYLVAHDEGHGFAQPINRRAFYAALEQFLSEHLGGRVQTSVPADIRVRLSELQAAGDSVRPD